MSYSSSAIIIITRIFSYRITNNEALIAIEDICLTIANKTLGQLCMISPNRPMHDFFDRELRREQ
ncbi:Uncharacterized protein FWK35_00023911 [Aphis craccivora]|uniref:Uncharacterized protein n=1 Tax=Aphis craccivora TaxID=307492 RepID=A0A6G0VWI7_APHCR|nr:Uncharacterized protein FWK35_00023911 [Aphis craccivora]